jgi:general secretion pathway protein G
MKLAQEIKCAPGSSDGFASWKLSCKKLKAVGDEEVFRRFRDNGMTLLELLIVIAVIGILAVIGVPYYLNSLERARQKQSMANMHTLALHLGAYNADTTRFPIADDIKGLNEILQETQNNSIWFVLDGWHNEFLYDTEENGKHYNLTSPGSDGIGTHGFDGEFPQNDFTREITIRDGEYVQWPQ